MNVVLWVLQGVPAAMFFTAGLTKSTKAKDKLVKNLPWVGLLRRHRPVYRR